MQSKLNSAQRTESVTADGMCDQPLKSELPEFATPDQFQAGDGTGDSGFGDLKLPLYPKGNLIVFADQVYHTPTEQCCSKIDCYITNAQYIFFC